jgi:hypothetical protein
MDAEIDFILSESKNLGVQDRIEILIIVRQYGENYIIEKKDGCRIQLNKLPSDAIIRIYNYMRRKLETNDP